MNRKEFIQKSSFLTAGLGLIPILSGFGKTSFLSGMSKTPIHIGVKRIVFIQLNGGNDFYNTLIPFENPLYYRARPTLSIQKKDLIPLTDQLGLHPALTLLKPYVQAGQLLIIHDIDQEAPEVSHQHAFRQWQAIPLSFHALEAEHQRIRSTGQLHPTTPQQAVHSPTERIYQNRVSADEFSAGLAKLYTQLGAYPSHPFYHIALDGFDLHQFQSNHHAYLLNTYAEGVHRFIQRLSRSWLWPDTMVVTYSEFGRALSENQAKGTHHGIFSSLFIFGKDLPSHGVEAATSVRTPESQKDAMGTPLGWNKVWTPWLTYPEITGPIY